MPINKSRKSRKQYLKQQFGDLSDCLSEEALDEHVQEILAAEDERIWAWARDPVTDLTQTEARDRAQSATDYGQYNISQATVSRKVNNLDRDMLTEELAFSQVSSPILEEDWYERQRSEQPEALEYWRGFLARLICDYEAMKWIDDPGGTPEWAESRLHKP